MLKKGDDFDAEIHEAITQIPAENEKMKGKIIDIIEFGYKLGDKIIKAICTIYDPEIPVNIYELGLIYDVEISEDRDVRIEMTLTSPNCPVAESLPVDVENKVKEIDSIENVKVNIVFEPPWTKDMMSEEAKLELGML